MWPHGFVLQNISRYFPRNAPAPAHPEGERGGKNAFRVLGFAPLADAECFLPLPQVLKDGGLLAPIITRLMNFFFFSRG